MMLAGANRISCAAGKGTGARPTTNAATNFVLTGVGASSRITGGSAAARCAAAGTAVSKGFPLAVAAAGAVTVKLRVLAIFVMLVVLMTLLVTFILLLIVVFRIRMPIPVTGGALVTTAGGVPTGAGTIRPGLEPGGGGTNTPCGPIGAGPATTPTATVAKAIEIPGGGGTKRNPGADQ